MIDGTTYMAFIKQKYRTKFPFHLGKLSAILDLCYILTKFYPP